MTELLQEWQQGITCDAGGKLGLDVLIEQNQTKILGMILVYIRADGKREMWVTPHTTCLCTTKSCVRFSPFVQSGNHMNTSMLDTLFEQSCHHMSAKV